MLTVTIWLPKHFYVKFQKTTSIMHWGIDTKIMQHQKFKTFSSQ